MGEVPFGLLGDFLVVWYGGYKVVDSWIFPLSVDVTKFFFRYVRFLSNSVLLRNRRIDVCRGSEWLRGGE